MGLKELFLSKEMFIVELSIWWGLKFWAQPTHQMGPKNIKAKQTPIHTSLRCNKPHKYKVGPKAPIFEKILFIA